MISQKVLQKAQWGLALPERDAAGAAAWGLRLGDGPGQSLHGPKGAFGAPSPYAPPGWTLRCPPGPHTPPSAVPCLCCLCSLFRTYAMTGAQKQPAEKWNSRRRRQPGSLWGSLKCPKLENWPPPHSCLLQHNYSSMTDMTN